MRSVRFTEGTHEANHKLLFQDRYLPRKTALGNPQKPVKVAPWPWQPKFPARHLLIIKAQAAHAKRPSRRSPVLLLHPCRNHFFWRIGSRRIDRTDEGDDLPKVVRGLDGKSHRRHGGMHAPIGDAIEAPFFQLR